MTRTIAVLGATGKTGRQVVRHALERGWRVRALVRDPAKAPAAWQGRVELVRGDALDADAVGAAVAGADAVVSALGHASGSPSDILQRAMQALVARLERDGPRRLVVVTGAAMRAPQDVPRTPDKLIGLLLRKLQPDLFEDASRMVEIVRASGLDWTLVRGGRMLDRPGKDRYRVGYVGIDTRPIVAHADLALFVVDCIDEGAHIRDMPMVSA